MARVGLVFGGRSVEHLVSVVSARTVYEGLTQAGNEVVPVGIAKNGAFVFGEAAESALRGERAHLSSNKSVSESLVELASLSLDVIFPIVHGTYGEDGAFQGFAETLNLPYVGPGVLASAMCMDKIICKKMLEGAGIGIVPYVALKKGESKAAIKSLKGYPLFVKPSVGGSSVGIQKVDDEAGLQDALDFAFRFWDEVLVESAVQGRELEIAVLGGKTPKASVVGEIVPGRDFYDYEDKYLGDTATLHAPAELPDGVLEKMQEQALRAFAALKCEGMARVDFFLDDEGALFINEINTLPGFTAISMYPRLFKESGIELAALVQALVDDALERHASRRSYDDEVNLFVRSIDEKKKG